MVRKIFNPVNLALAAGIVHVASIIFQLPAVSMISKPLIMPAIALFLFASLKNLQVEIPKLLFSALLFSWLGDLALMIPSENSAWFLAGVGFFLVAQISYFFLFPGLVNDNKVNSMSLWYLIACLIIFAYASILWLKLYPGLGNLKIPVAVYTLALSAMVCASVYRYRRTNNHSFLFLFTGAVLFMLSDSMIAIHKFMIPSWNERIWVMTTYILAQLLIANGIILHYRKA